MTQLDVTAPTVGRPTPLGTAAVETDLPGQVERRLAEFLTGKRAEADAVDPAFGEAVDALAGFVLGGGKRIRPVFAWWGWRGAGGDPTLSPDETDAVLTAVSALELIQGCALVHDDLMDASLTRRGAPTVHVAFADRHRGAGWSGSAERFGLSAAVLLGDVALAWADDMLVGSGIDATALGRALPVWQAMRTKLLGGQYLDVLTQVRADESVGAALRIDRYKTAAYTVERPLHLGAALAGATPRLVAGYRAYGVDVGTAFQLRDDLLGVFGDPAVTGKPAGDDLREGKRTLLLAFALRTAAERDRTAELALLRGAVGDPDLDDDRVDAVRQLLVDLGADRQVEREIDRLATAGLAALRAAAPAEPAGEHLVELAQRATRRDS